MRKTHTFSQKIRASNGSRPRIGQTRVASRNMPATIIHKAWLADGTQIAICQINDSYIGAHFDANEGVLGMPVEFKYGGGREKAFEWAKDQIRIARGF